MEFEPLDYVWVIGGGMGGGVVVVEMLSSGLGEGIWKLFERGVR